jgi:hypothetical protein
VRKAAGRTCTSSLQTKRSEDPVPHVILGEAEDPAQNSSIWRITQKIIKQKTAHAISL